MDNILVITQNLKLESLASIQSELVPGSALIVSTQFVFENERERINEALGVKCEYVDFADLISDAERQKCDEEAFEPIPDNVGTYYAIIKEKKNEFVVRNLLDKYPCNNLLLVCDDLGIDASPWLNAGFRKVQCEYYYDHTQENHAQRSRVVALFYGLFSTIKKYFKADIWVSNKDNQKYLFFGSTNRIGYRIDLEWDKASKWENVKFIVQYLSIRLLGFMPKNKTIRLTTFHEDTHWHLPDHPNFNVKKIQDGYLPPNYTSKYLYYYGPQVEFYTWDVIGQHTFQYHRLNSRVMPIRKKLFLPEAHFPKKLTKVLCAASGTGDWTAIKNRSDDDRLVWAIGKVAKLFPNVEFIYRCHPVWIHPQHSGVNAINRCAEYIDWLNLPNYKISSHIPMANQKGGFVLSFKRSSFEEDLKGVDIVLGEHSVAMIDAGFKGILFASCNMTGHRDFFEDLTKLGFPHCESVDEIAKLLKSVITPEFKVSYEQAIKNYNEMTDREG